MHQFRKFLDQTRNGTGDSLLDKYIPFLVYFIEKNYRSIDNKNFDLNDFIQECYLKMTEFEDDGLSIVRKAKKLFQKVYDEMSQSSEYDYVEPVELMDTYDEIDFNTIDYNRMLDSIKSRFKSEQQKKTLDCIREDMDNKELAQELNISYSNASAMKKIVYGKIHDSIEFKRLYEDDLSKFFSNYQVFVLKHARESRYRFLEGDVLKFWRKSFKKDNYYYFACSLKLLLEFFYSLKDKCSEEPYNYYLDDINKDISNLIAYADLDSGKMRSSLRDEIKEVIKQNEDSHSIKK